MSDKYPSFRYHRELAPDGKLIQGPDEEPNPDEGWVTSPAGFHGKEYHYVPTDAEARAQAPVVAAALPAPKYPAARYDTPGDHTSMQIVIDAEADAKLDPAVWKATYDPAAWEAPAAPVQPPFTPSTPMEPGGATLPPPTTPPPAPVAMALTEEQKVGFYGTTVPNLIAQLETVDNASALDVLEAAELANPKGERKTVLTAIKARRALLLAGV